MRQLVAYPENDPRGMLALADSEKRRTPDTSVCHGGWRRQAAGAFRNAPSPPTAARSVHAPSFFQRLSAGGVNRLEERLWPSSPAITSLRGGPAGRPRLSINRLGKRPAIQFAYVKVNRFDRNVNRSFSGGFVILCTVSSLYL